MSRSSALAPLETIGELLEQLGRVPPDRVRLVPTPGTATERDLVRLHQRTDRLYELVDGTLVEKVMGYPESCLAVELLFYLRQFLAKHDLGNLAGADGTMRLMPGLLRVPDISFVRWERLPGRTIPEEPILGLAPDLAVEVLSENNTPGEMTRKLKEYFLSGVQLVWFVDMRKRTVEVFTAPDRSRVLTEEQTLDGGEVLPGFALPLRQLFARVAAPAPGSSPRKRASKGKRKK